MYTPPEGLVKTSVLLRKPFLQACNEWLESQRGIISDRTFRDYQYSFKVLNREFAMMRLEEIDDTLVRTAQQKRRKECGPVTVNHEYGLLAHILKDIGRPLEHYHPMPVRRELRGRALTTQEKDRLLRIAKENPAWFVVYLFAAISVNTSAGPQETFTLRLKNVHLEFSELGEPPHITIHPEGAKNVHRIRKIPLNPEAFEAVTLAMERARKLGASDPEHFLFPQRIGQGQGWDPTRHQKWIKTAWKSVCIAAGLPHLRPYDLRHTAITAMLEDPETSEMTVEGVCGHVNPKMKKNYAHIHIQQRFAAVNRLWKKRKFPQSVKQGEATGEITPEERKMVGVLRELLKNKS